MKKGFLIAIAVLVAVLVLVSVFLGSLIRSAVVAAGPVVAGVPVELKQVRVNPFSGRVEIRGLLIGNPEGFKTPSIMEVDSFLIKINLASVFSDTVVVEQILIRDPKITYERGLRASNLGRLQENMAPAESERKVAAAPEKEKSAPAKKVVISDFEMTGAMVNVALTATAGRSVSVPLPPVRLSDIGKESDGVSLVEMISKVFGEVASAVTDAVAASGSASAEVLGDAGKAALDTTKEAADALRERAGRLLGK